MSLKLLYFGLLGLCLVALLLRYRKLPAYCHWFVPIIALALTTELIKDYFVENSNVLQRVYQAIECMLLLGFYNTVLIKPKNRNSLKIIYVVYLLTCVCYYLLYRRSFNTKDYFDFIAEAFIVCILVTLFFFELLDYKQEVNLLKFGAFWINAVNLIFYGGCFFAMAFYEQISRNNTALSLELRAIPHYLNLFLYTAYLIIFSFVKKSANHVV